MIQCDEVVIKPYDEEKKLFQQILLKIKESVKCKIFLLAFSLTTIALLIAVSIFCSLIKYQTKQKHLPFHNTNNELGEVLYH